MVLLENFALKERRNSFDLQRNEIIQANMTANGMLSNFPFYYSFADVQNVISNVLETKILLAPTLSASFCYHMFSIFAKMRRRPTQLIVPLELQRLLALKRKRCLFSALYILISIPLPWFGISISQNHYRKS